MSVIINGPGRSYYYNNYLTAEPDSGYYVRIIYRYDLNNWVPIWECGGVPTMYSVTVPGWEPNEYLIQFDPLPGPFQVYGSAIGQGSISPLSRWIARGSSASFNFSPNPGYCVTNITVSRMEDNGINEEHFFGLSSIVIANVIQDIALTVQFEKDNSTISITASAGSNGSINPSGSSTVTAGQSKTYTFSPNSGYQIDTVLVDGSSVGSPSSYTFTNIATSHTISVTFKVLDGYVITATAGANGTISPAGSVTAIRGANKSFTIVPNQYCSIADVVVDGVSRGAISSYIFTNVQTDHTISATFAKTPYTISSMAGLHGSIAPSGEVTVYQGDTKSYVITPDEGYVIQDILVDGVYVDIPSTGVLFID